MIQVLLDVVVASICGQGHAYRNGHHASHQHCYIVTMKTRLQQWKLACNSHLRFCITHTNTHACTHAHRLFYHHRVYIGIYYSTTECEGKSVGFIHFLIFPSLSGDFTRMTYEVVWALKTDYLCTRWKRPQFYLHRGLVLWQPPVIRFCSRIACNDWPDITLVQLTVAAYFAYQSSVSFYSGQL